MTALLVLAVLAGASLQRITGMGFALVSAPLVILAVGPASAVLIINVLAVVTAATVLVRVRQDTDWPLLARLLPGALAGVAIGTAAVTLLPPAMTQIVAGVLIILGLAASAVAAKRRTVPRNRGLVTAAALISGTMGAVAGVSGPAMAVLAVLTRWHHVGFVATMQPYFAIVGATTVVARLIAQPSAGNHIGMTAWLLMASALGLGVWIGGRLAMRLPATVSQRLMIVIANAGALATILDGAAQLL